jgi:pyruvate formate-lyase activating enzyme-like uncharacterized protein
MSAKELLIQKVNEIWHKEPNTPDNESLKQHMTKLIEIGVQNKVCGDIKRRQEAIPGVTVTAHGALATWGEGTYTPGCQKCLYTKAAFQSIRGAADCNLNCKFCYYYDKPQAYLPRDHYEIEGKLFSLDDLKNLIDKRCDDVKGIAWVYYEPFTAIDKHLKAIDYISQKGIHQWLYTNGTLATEDKLKQLADCGLTELRFDLAATMCSDNVLKIMKTARKYFEYLVIESPMFEEYMASFLKNKDKILDTGLDHINCAELHLVPNTASHWANEPLYLYNDGYVSPISSRNYTYDLIELAEKEQWKGIFINDCCNSLKYYRGVKTGFPSLRINIMKEMTPSINWYTTSVDRYYDSGVFDELEGLLTAG